MFYDVLECVEVIEVDSGGENCRKLMKFHRNPWKSSKSKPNPDFGSKITKFRVLVPKDPPESARSLPTGLLCYYNFIRMVLIQKNKKYFRESKISAAGGKGGGRLKCRGGLTSGTYSDLFLRITYPSKNRWNSIQNREKTFSVLIEPKFWSVLRLLNRGSRPSSIGSRSNKLSKFLTFTKSRSSHFNRVT